MKIVAWLLVWGICWQIFEVGLAEDQAESRAIVERAIKAQRGLEKLSKHPAIEVKQKGKVYTPDGILDGAEFTLDEFITGLGRLKSVIRIDSEKFDGGNLTQTIVIHGEEFWLFQNGVDTEKGKEFADELRERNVADGVVRLDCLKGKEFEFSPLGEVKVKDKPVNGVRVASKGRRDVNLYFSKETGLLVKSEQRIRDVMQDLKEVTQERVIDEYKELDGVLWPVKVALFRDGKKFMEWEVTELKLAEKFDDGTFAKPTS